MRIGPTARVAMSLAITVGGIVTACRNDVPGPTLPAPIAPEVTRQAPKPQPIDPKKQREQQRKQQRHSHSASVSELQPQFLAATGDDEPPPVPPPTQDPVDGGINDVIDLPPVPDADVDVVRDAGQPLLPGS